MNRGDGQMREGWALEDETGGSDDGKVGLARESFAIAPLVAPSAASVGSPDGIVPAQEIRCGAWMPYPEREWRVRPVVWLDRPLRSLMRVDEPTRDVREDVERDGVS